MGYKTENVELMEEIKSVLIKDTTREERIRIVNKSLEVCGQECQNSENIAMCNLIAEVNLFGTEKIRHDKPYTCFRRKNLYE